MAAQLPMGWEWDYDGKRWFYRYIPTNHIQFTFPKPGDEFPEYVGDFAAPVDLAPEEKLVSQQQIKRRSTLGDPSSKQASRASRRERAVSSVNSEQDDGGSPFWLQPDGLMYMGPGAYTDISPLQEEDEERGEGSGKANEEKGAATAAAAANVSSAKATERISPITSAETTPLVYNSKPATATPEVESAVIVESSGYVPVDVVAEQPPEIALLDSKEVPRNPLGFLAELPTDLTPQCDDEINPAPVELPSNEMMETSEPVLSYANGFELTPVELPSDAVPRRRRNSIEQKSLASQTTLQQERLQQRAHQAAQELPKRPYQPVRQSSMPQSSSAITQTSNKATEPTPGRYQPYNPTAGSLGDAAANRYSVADIRRLEGVNDNKRHSLAGPAPSHVLPSDIPTALLPPHVPPKQPLDSADIGKQTAMSGSGARHESVYGPITHKPGSDLAHFPSVLKPARGRPVIKSPPQSQGASPARSYQAYKPYRDLQRDIEETVQLFSKTGYGQGTTTTPEASHSDRPQVSRTSTLPADLPALPFIGVRPNLPAASASAPVIPQNLQSHQAPSDEFTGDIAQEYSAPLPQSTPDLPPQLSLSRKSPPPRDSVSTAISSFKAPTTTEADMPSNWVTPTPSNTEIVSPEVTASAGPEEDSACGAVGDTESHTEHSGGAAQPDPPAVSSMPSPASGEPEGPKRSEGTVTSSVQQQPARPPVPVTSFAVESTPDVSRVVQSTPITSPVPGAKSPSEHLPTEAHTTATDQHQGLSASAVSFQGLDRSGASQLGVAASGDVQESHPVVSGSHAVVHVHQPPPGPNTTLPAAQTGQNETPSLRSESAIPPGSEGCQPFSSNSGNGSDTQQQVTPAQLCANGGTPDPRVPGPLSRASSPPTTLPNKVPSGPPATAVIAGVLQDSPPSAGQASLNQGASHAPGVGLGPSPTGSSSSLPSNTMPSASSPAAAYTLPPEHHPLGSHPANASSQASPPESSTSIKADSSRVDGPDNQQPSGPSAQPVCYATHQVPGVAQNHAKDAQGAGSSGRQSSRATSVPFSSPSPMPDLSQLQPMQAPQRSMSQPLQTGVPAQLPMQPGGQIPVMPVAQGQTVSAAAGSGEGSQNMPQRALSLPVISPSAPAPHPGMPGTARQMATMYPPPVIPPGMLLQGVQSGGLPQQQYAFQPGVFPQLPQPGLQGMQYGPVAPHMMMQPSQTMPAAYVMPMQPTQPAKEEKSWFGRLFRSDSVKANPANKLPKVSCPQVPLAFSPPQPLHPNQPVPRPQFVPVPQNIQPNTWKNNDGNGSQHAAPVNKFQVPNRANDSQPVIPPPNVRQAIQRHEQRLQQAPEHGPNSSGQPLQGGQQAVGQGQCHGQEGKGDLASSSSAAAAGNKSAGGGWGNANVYDGADWGDDADY
ncbi:hypothetical protein C8A03DRAFT_11540 [Achaetomium macrosporum]|uniref:WW domain-containing protein n=1 Tax=Achaetomium macrosporum TaxID=79813 RepID=A0AAN7CHK3_9PEZI|nr:hypothetical protein C8A03DRAFT_11540 [Achaetomium macrosporum]